MASVVCSRLPAVGLLLCIFWPRDAEAFVVNHPEPEKSKDVELFQFVLHNDDKWDLVLDQKILINDHIRPPYQGKDVNPGHREIMRLFNNDATQVSPYTVLHRVLNKFKWSGSHINYAINVLQTAFLCTTFTFVSMQIELIALIDHKIHDLEHEHESMNIKMVTNILLNDSWKILTVFIDKQAVVQSDLELMADLSYKYTELAINNEDNKIYVLKLIQTEIEKIIAAKCVRTESDVMYKLLGVDVNYGYIIGHESTYKDVLVVYENLAEKLMETYEEFNITSMDYTNWKQILDFQCPIFKNINLYVKVDDILNDDPLGKSILNEKKKKQESIIDSLGQPSLVLKTNTAED